MTRRNYAGTWTALITPFTNDGSVDEEALRTLVNDQIAGGVTGILPLGTTGESPTISSEEGRRIFEIVVEEANGRVKVLAGTGSNSTSHSVESTRMAKEVGADLCLVVCPYYNKPTQEGLRLHYLAIAEVGLPIMIYNIKGRTGINMSTDTLMTLAENPNIVAVKEASGDLEQMREVIARRPDNFTVLSGDDGLTLELIRMGGDGVVSVASNVVPADVSDMVNRALDGNFDEAERINSHLARLFKDLFIETNPIPVKYAVHRRGQCGLNYRLPMCPPSSDARAVLDETLRSYNLIS